MKSVTLEEIERIAHNYKSAMARAMLRVIDKKREHGKQPKKS